jgi:hypothetical protein
MNAKKWVYTCKPIDQSKTKMIGKEILPKASKAQVTYRFKLRKAKPVDRSVSL